MDHDIRDPAPAPTTAPEPTENTPQKRKRIAQEQLERVRQENEAIEAEEELAQEERKKRAAAERLAVLVDKGDAYGNPERPSTPPPRPPNRRTFKIQAHPKAGAPGVSTASARSFAALARAESRGDRRGAQRRRLLVYLAPSSCTPRRTTPGPRWGYATARLGLRAPIAAEVLGSTATTTGRDPPPRSRPRTRHQLRLAGAVPFPLLAGGSAAPLSTATLLSTLEIGLGPSAARPPRSPTKPARSE